MPYNPITWQDGAQGGTPITAAALNRMEQGIVDAHAAIDATKGYVDSHANATSVHGATSSATPNRIIIRDSAGRAKVAAPSAGDDIATKRYVDQVAAGLIIASVSPSENSAALQPNSEALVNGSWVAPIPPGATALEIWFVACRLENDFRFRIGFATSGVVPGFHSVYDTDAGGEISTGTPLVSAAVPVNALYLSVRIQNVSDSARTPSSLYGLSFGFRFT